LFSEKKYEIEYYAEPLCECFKCSNIHLRKDRTKKALNSGKFLCIYLCPKCGAEKYLWVGDKILKRRAQSGD